MGRQLGRCRQRGRCREQTSRSPRQRRTSPAVAFEFQVRQRVDDPAVPGPPGAQGVVADRGQAVERLRGQRPQRQQVQVGLRVDEPPGRGRVQREAHPVRHPEGDHDEGRNQEREPARQRRHLLEGVHLLLCRVDDLAEPLRGAVERLAERRAGHRHLFHRPGRIEEVLPQTPRRAGSLTGRLGQPSDDGVSESSGEPPGDTPGERQHIARDLTDELPGRTGVQAHRRS